MMTNPTGRLTQGQFSFLPDLTDAEIALPAKLVDLVLEPLGHAAHGRLADTLAEQRLGDGECQDRCRVSGGQLFRSTARWSGFSRTTAMGFQLRV